MDHKFYVNKHGVEVPRVHTILSLIGVNQLLLWSNFLGLNNVHYQTELKRTANVGSLFHEVVDQALEGKEVNINYDKYNIKDGKSKKEFSNCLKSFSLWFIENKQYFRVTDADIQVVGDKYGGTIDCIIKGFKNKNSRIIVDYKTSALFTLDHFLQLGAYVILVEDELGYEVEGVMILRVDKRNGKIAKTRFMSRKEIEPFIGLFKLLYCVFEATSSADLFVKNHKRTLKMWKEEVTK